MHKQNQSQKLLSNRNGCLLQFTNSLLHIALLILMMAKGTRAITFKKAHSDIFLIDSTKQLQIISDLIFDSL